MDPELQFANPAWLWIGALVCGALVYGFMRWNRARERDLGKLVHQRFLEQLTASYSRRRRQIKQWVWLAAVALVFIAVARPQYGYEFREVKRRGIDLVFAIDTSRSMLAEDVVPNRLERSQIAISDFIDRLEGDRVGLIPFAGKAFSLCPLTLDYSAFRQSLDVIDTDIIPHQGTDLASAVSEANRLFDEEGNSHRILILITDGEDLQGEVTAAISAANEKNMIIHAVGVGDPAGALIPITRRDGRQDFVRDQSGQAVRTSLDESTLKKIADATGGIYVPLGKTGQGLNQIYNEKLRLVPKTEMDQRLDRIPLERFEWPLALAILLLLIEYLLNETRRSYRSGIMAGFRWLSGKGKGVALLAIFLIVGGGVQAGELDPRVAYNSGTSAYEAGDFEAAERSLSESLNDTIDLQLQQRGYYNLGNARYRLGQKTLQENPEETIKKWESSIKAFEDALALNSNDDDASYNRDFVAAKLEELKKQQNQDQEKQDQENQDQEKQDQEKQDQEKQDQEKQGEEKQGEEEQGEEKQGEEKQGEEKQGEEKQGEQAGEPKEGEEGERRSFSEQSRQVNEMSKEEAAQLLEALKRDERSVIPLPDRNTYRRSVPNNTTRGKTW